MIRIHTRNVHLHKIDGGKYYLHILHCICIFQNVIQKGHFLCIIHDILEWAKYMYDAQLVLLHNILLTNDILLTDVFRLY